MIVLGMLVCCSFLISMCMFIVSKALLISSAILIVYAGEAIWLQGLPNLNGRWLPTYSNLVAQHGKAGNGNIWRVNHESTTVTFICMLKA